MPYPALNVNWEAVKAHALVHGIRPTAEHFGIAPGTLFARSSREKWLEPARQLQAAATTALPSTMQPKASNACSPSQAAVNSLLRYSGKTRIRLAKGLANGALAVSRMSGETVVAQAHQVKALAGASKDTFPDWAAPDQRPLINIQISPCSTGEEKPIQAIDCTQEAD